MKPRVVDRAAKTADPLLAALRRAAPALTAEALTALLAADARQFRAPAVSFDARFYAAQLPAAVARAINPLQHYMQIGHAAGLAPHPCFDLAFMYGTDTPAPRGTETPALLEILDAVDAPYATPNVLFEPALYAGHLPAGALDGLPPFEHFLRFWADHRVPFSRYFDVEFYLHQNRHVARAGLNPLVHYFSQPIEERRGTNPMIHRLYYSAMNPHVLGDPFVHYIRFGLPAGVMPNPYAEQELRAKLTDDSPVFRRDLLDSYVRVG